MESYDFVAENLAAVRARIDAAALRSGRAPDSVKLMAVSKFHPLEAVQSAYSAGARLFGENRVQEAEGKFPAFLAMHPEVRLHLIGTLQTNKAKKAASFFSSIDSVDSLDLLKELDRRSRAQGRALDLLFELHTGEDSKSGFPSSAALLEAVAWLLNESARADNDSAPAGPAPAEGSGSASGGLRLRGLMTMAPFTDNEAAVRASFRSLRECFEKIKAEFDPPGFTELSMGMSGDFETAIDEGSTIVRIGTAIFGEREKR